MVSEELQTGCQQSQTHVHRGPLAGFIHIEFNQRLNGQCKTRTERIIAVIIKACLTLRGTKQALGIQYLRCRHALLPAELHQFVFRLPGFGRGTGAKP